MAAQLALVPPSWSSATSETDEGDIARALFAVIIEERFRHPELLLSTVRWLCSPHMLKVYDVIDGFEWGLTDWPTFDSLEESLTKIPLSEALAVLETMAFIPQYLIDNTAVVSFNGSPFLGLLRSVLPGREPEFRALLDETIAHESDWESNDFPLFVRLAMRLFL